MKYELALIMRAMEKPDAAGALKRLCLAMMNQDTIIKQIDHLGEKQLPYRMRSTQKDIFRTGRYFVLDIEAPPTKVLSMRQKLKQDVDVVRISVLKKED